MCNVSCVYADTQVRDRFNGLIIILCALQRGDFDDSLGGRCCSTGPGDATDTNSTATAAAAADVHTRVDYTRDKYDEII